METRVLFCSGCDHDVTLRLRGGRAGEPLDQVIGAECLEIGERCTGTTCPICAVPPHARATAERVRTAAR